MNTSASNEDGEHGFQIAPMVDIVFVLLLFFMTYKTVRELHVEATPSGQPVARIITPTMPIMIDIMENDDVIINGRIIAASSDHRFEELKKWLNQIRSTSTNDEPFVIRAKDATRYERVVRILAVLNKAGFKNVSFA
jgi:biopolymer transport protein ExbD